MKHTIQSRPQVRPSLFSKKKVLKHARRRHCPAPSPFPLSEFQLLQEDGSPRFKPSIQPEKLLQMAHAEPGRLRGVLEAEYPCVDVLRGDLRDETLSVLFRETFELTGEVSQVRSAAPPLSGGSPQTRHSLSARSRNDDGGANGRNRRSRLHQA